ncbi:hypothetical protein [Streptomyces sp. NBC_00566]|uniref:hypothetical protein n=1 Tax=Streptomyces sp. NBC_00566 TaxID=2975778 RepID=UPI002E80CF26|nr:hypothetical protein [Streptomyces sp. NBC_00566]WUB88279.1 hypothetical protein OG812_17520 [Streptomyces sp. NBC_00566]
MSPWRKGYVGDDEAESRKVMVSMGYCGAWNPDGRLWCTKSPSHEGKHANRFEKTHPTDTVGVQWA